jgi:predicted secreted Zn-dependent protease
VEECGPCPVFASFTLAFALQLRKKHGKTSVRVRKTSVRVQYTYYQKHPHITKPLQTHTLQNVHIHKHTHTHTLQNNIKPSQYKLKQNVYRISNIMGRKNNT